jgi:hypothetical protein
MSSLHLVQPRRQSKPKLAQIIIAALSALHHVIFLCFKQSLIPLIASTCRSRLRPPPATGGLSSPLSAAVPAPCYPSCRPVATVHPHPHHHARRHPCSSLDNVASTSSWGGQRRAVDDRATVHVRCAVTAPRHAPRIGLAWAGLATSGRRTRLVVENGSCTAHGFNQIEIVFQFKNFQKFLYTSKIHRKWIKDHKNTK